MKRPVSTDVRALAAAALARIVGGRSLRAEFAASSPWLPDARDRALLSALLHAGARWWLRYDAAVSRLLRKPLSPQAAPIGALAVLGLVQIEVLGMAPYAAVAATVEAARALGKPNFAALLNALLRRWLRERETLCADLDADAVTRTAHPAWLIERIATDWPAQAEAILAANNTEPPLWLRANRRRTTRAGLAQRLASAGFDVAAPAQPADALRLARSTDATALPGFAEGLCSVQDGAAQFAADLLDLHDGQRVLDACAAPGGKSAHVLERADVELLALDRDAQRIERIAGNLSRLGLRAQLRAADAAAPREWWDGTAFDRILLDAPCSASGVIRRQPDIRLHRRPGDIAALAAEQQRLLDALWPLLARGGRLVYATCSVFAAENAAPVERLRAQHADCTPLAAGPAGWHAPAGGGAQNLPGESGMDGFYYAVLEKAR